MTKQFLQLKDPVFLLFGLILPVLFLVIKKKRGKKTIYFSSNALFKNSAPTLKSRLEIVLPFLKILALLLFILALSRPQWGNKTTEILSEGIDIMLTIDTSGSMKALDFHLQNSRVNRLDVIKKVVDEFIGRRAHDRMGMVIFGEEAYTQCPLTVDTDTLRSFLKWIRIGMAGDSTAIGNALAVSVKRLKDQPTKSKVIILLTDGKSNAGEIAPETAADIAKQFNIKVYTIGVGSRGAVPYPEETPFGTRMIYAKLDLDEDTLKSIATITGGKYFRATETEELEEIYATIDKLEKSEVKIKEFSEFKELYPSFVLAGLIALLAEIILSRTIFLRIP